MKFGYGYVCVVSNQTLKFESGQPVCLPTSLETCFWNTRFCLNIMQVHIRALKVLKVKSHSSVGGNITSPGFLFPIPIQPFCLYPPTTVYKKLQLFLVQAYIQHLFKCNYETEECFISRRDEFIHETRF